MAALAAAGRDAGEGEKGPATHDVIMLRGRSPALAGLKLADVHQPLAELLVVCL